VGHSACGGDVCKGELKSQRGVGKRNLMIQDNFHRKKSGKKKKREKKGWLVMFG